jgi:hypothetical protein
MAFADALKSGLREDIPLTMMDYNVNAPEFSEALARALLDMLK